MIVVTNMFQGSLRLSAFPATEWTRATVDQIYNYFKGLAFDHV